MPYGPGVYPLYRILDANANRAREALRVLEDAARFALNDAALSAQLKSARHELRAALDAAGLDPLILAHHRDVEGDVGTATSTPAEMTRDGLPGIAAAASARLGEALRVVEESLKALHEPGAHAAHKRIEQLRYLVYAIGASVIASLGTGRARQWRLCVILTESLCTLPWESVAERALAGGADCLQLREKALPDRELLRRARRLVELAHPRAAAVVLNDRPDLALLAGTDGVHVGPHDTPPADVRALAGGRLLLGVSASTLDEALAAVAAGADYLGLGSMFPTATKEKSFVSGPALLRAVLADPRAAALPHLAVGGITLQTAPALLAAGCRGVAVCSAICASPQPEEVCRALVEAMNR